MANSLDRRAVLGLAALMASASALPAEAEEETGEQHMARMMGPPPADAPKVVMLIHPKMAALDLIGPMTVLTILRCNIQLVWKDRKPVLTDVRIPFAATHDFGDCNADTDVLFVPGGIMGTIDCMNDPAVCRFLADRGSRAKWVTAVCTGGLALAAAGLLEGYDATAHWAVADLLPIMGARHVDRRVVIDRNRMTGGGVTAGIDFGLTLAAKLKGGGRAARPADDRVRAGAAFPERHSTRGWSRKDGGSARQKGNDGRAGAAGGSGRREAARSRSRLINGDGGPRLRCDGSQCPRIGWSASRSIRALRTALQGEPPA